MFQREESALMAAEYLLQIKAIKLSPDQPFTWASGLRSPIYCDNRRILSYPKIRTFVRQELAKLVTEAFGEADIIAGVATGGIAHGVLVAQDLGLPFAYVRSEAKGHGLTNMIEGMVEEGQTVIVIEDLVSTGKSSLNAVNALREAGCRVKGMASIFSYGLDAALRSFAAANCQLEPLTGYDTLLRKAIDERYINDDQLRSLNEWRMNPQQWSTLRGGPVL